jgi:hypothetical protein
MVQSADKALTKLILISKEERRTKRAVKRTEEETKEDEEKDAKEEVPLSLIDKARTSYKCSMRAYAGHSYAAR